MKLLIVGAGGQVGTKLARRAKSQGSTVYGAYRTRKPSVMLDGKAELDKTNINQVVSVLGTFQPDWVVDTGALHNVDYCESHPEEAMAVNARGSRNIAEECCRLNARLVFISTDFVFDGIEAPYTEESRPNPLSVYARSKLEGEANALEANPNNTCVVRPAVIYSWASQEIDASSSSGKPLNFGAWLVSQLAANKDVNIVEDQITSPTLADDLAGAILALLASSRGGVFHTAGTTPLSRYQFSVELARKMGYETSLVHPILTATLKQVAKRPPNSSLISEKLRRGVGYSMMGITEALDVFKAQAQGRIQG